MTDIKQRLTAEMDMIEQVARAICRETYSNDDDGSDACVKIGTQNEGNCVCCNRQARAAIEAMREPTKNTTDKPDIVKRWKAYRESMGTALFGEPEHMAAEMVDEIERLRDLLKEAHADLAAQVDHDYQYRHDYPDEMRRWKRDMDLPNRIAAALRKDK